ncbi:MAG: MAPEG family protein [Pseudoxanthomonas sp.]
MNYIDIVAVIAVLQLLFFSGLVGQARGKYGVAAPAVVGHELFERAYRVQMNTLELLVAFLPALFLAGKYWSQPVIAGIGAIYVLGRFIYWRAYMGAPKSRGLGFGLSSLPVLLLLVAALIGALYRSA